MNEPTEKQWNIVKLWENQTGTFQGFNINEDGSMLIVALQRIPHKNENTFLVMRYLYDTNGNMIEAWTPGIEI